MKKSYLTLSFLKAKNKLKLFSLLFFGLIIQTGVVGQAIPASDGGSNCIDCTPPGWFKDPAGTPDISDFNNAAGGNTWDIGTLPLPPNGHTDWISLRDLGSLAFEETIYTEMTGLVPGNTYEVTIYSLTTTATAGTYAPQYNDSFSYQIGTNPIQTITLPVATRDTWNTNTFQFIAGGTSEFLYLRPGFNAASTSPGDRETVQISVTLNAITLIADPNIEITGNGNVIIDGQTTTSSLDNTDFGSTLLGNPITQQFTITNTGTENLSLSSPVINDLGSGTADFSITTTPLLLTPGASTTFDVTFNPTSVGIQTVEISVASNDPDENPYTFNIQANGQVDTDGDGIPDSSDLDDDNDGILDTTEGTADTDNDGIINALDLDSDNDGIADVVEAGYSDVDMDGIIDGFIDIDTNGYFDGLENPELYSQNNAASTITEVDATTGWFTGGGAGITFVSEPTESHKGNHSLGLYTTVAGGGRSINYVMSATIGTTYHIKIWAKRGTSLSGMFATWTGFSGFTNTPFTSDDWTLYEWTLTATAVDPTIQIYAHSSSGETNGSIFVDEISIRVASTQILPDTNNNGIPDYLDLDSDYDGCYDALEGAADYTVADLNVDGSLAAPVDFRGIPGGVLQATTVDVTDSSVVSSVCDTDGDGIVFTLDLDDDNDGIVDTEEGFGDTDGDGIADSVDLDSDNDGISDLVESGNVDVDNNGIIDGFIDIDGTGLHDPLDNPELYAQTNAASILTEVNATSGWSANGAGVTLTSDPTESIDGSYSLNFSTTVSGGGRYLDYNMFPVTVGATYHIQIWLKKNANANGRFISFGLNGFPLTNFVSDEWTLYEWFVTPTVTDPHIFIYPHSTSSGTNGTIYIDKVSIREVVQQTLLDSDLDTFADYLDLDSENDGIPDNVEAQTTLGYISPSGVFDVNGFDTAYVGGLTPVNTDGVDNPDYLDDDSDNEGANDTVEAGLTLAGTVGSNGLDANSETVDTYLDVNGIFDNPQADFPDSDNDVNSGGDVDYRDAIANPDFDGDGIFDVADIDADNDGIPNVDEYGGNDPYIDGDSDGIPIYLDDDDSNPAIGNDNGLVEAAYDTDGDNMANHLDLDADNDTIFDLYEAGHSEVDADADGMIDGIPADFGANGLFNAIEDNDTATAVITYALIDFDLDLRFNFLDIDDDNDNVNTIFEVDNTDGDGNPSTGVIVNTDGDADLDYLDIDDDGDGINTIFEIDNTDGDGDPTTGTVIDTDSDTTLDYLDIDDDGDGINTIFENPDPDANGDPSDAQNTDSASGDVLPDYLDADDDGDGIPTANENADPNTDNDPADAVDTDGDTIPDYLDADDDGDGIDTLAEDVDGDGDPTNDDSDGDTVPNYLDLDSDNDGIPDSVETIVDTDLDGVPNYIDLDSDDDGIYDTVEGGTASFDTDNDGMVNLISVGANGLYDGLETFPDSGIRDVTSFPIPDSDGDSIIDSFELDADNDGCLDVTEAGYTDGDSDGLLGTSPPAHNAQGLVTSGIDGYTTPNDIDGNSVFDFQEASTTTTITTQPIAPAPVLVGSTINIDVVASGNIYQWQVSTDNVTFTDIADNANYSGTNTANLTISNVPLAFSGNYYRVVVSTNNYACDTPVTSDAVQITVQGDNDGDGIDDVTDLDDDNDGIPDTDEDAGVSNDVDGDGIINSFDLDSDNDGIYDIVESGQINPGNNVVDVDNDGIIDAANSGTVGANGLFDNLEDAPDSGNLSSPTADSDADGIVDSNETNADNDGCNDAVEARFTIPVTDADPDDNGYLGTGTFGAGLTVDAQGRVTSAGFNSYVIDPADNDSNGVYDFQEVGEQVTIAVQPTDQVVILNATANFDVTLGNGVNPTYQWYESTDGGISYNPLSNGGIYTGTNTATLTINANTLALDGNMYRVVIAAPGYACGGSVTSNSALLTVYPDFDGDGIGDPIDLDDDNDGILDTVEGTGDFDGDGQPNHHDVDADGDGIYDIYESGRTTGADANGDGMLDGSVGANGVPDSIETAVDSGIVNYTIRNTDGDAQPNFLDRDDDGDGVNTINEGPDPNGNHNPSDAVNTDGDGRPNYLDIDDDGDGILTRHEGTANPDGDGRANYLDLDSDGDGIPDNVEGQTTAGYIAPSGVDSDNDGLDNAYDATSGYVNSNGILANTVNSDAGTPWSDASPDYLDLDSDGDTVPDRIEGHDHNFDGLPDVGPSGDSDNDGLDNSYDSTTGYADPNGNVVTTNPATDLPNTDGTGDVNYRDRDDDGDSILTIYENPDPNSDGNFTDSQNSDASTGDIRPDYLDADDDGDGIPTINENPDPNGDGNPSDAQDIDEDGIPDYLDNDDDNDGIATIDEDIDGDGNPANDDNDGDGVPNYLDIDDDNDGILTITEGDNFDDYDLDGYPDYLDLDSDDDGIPDNVESQTTAAYLLPTGVDDDNDGLDNAYDSNDGGYPNSVGITPNNNDGTDNPDYLDTDSDNDSVPDSIEGHDFDANGEADVVASGSDSDGDGLDDAFDGSIGDFADPNGLAVVTNPATDLPNRDGNVPSIYAPITMDDEVDYRDADDDGDGIPTAQEDGDLDGDPTNDDCDEDGTPDYLDYTSCSIVPEAFSPNGDGVNDTLVVPALAQYPNFTMEVYDRWGNIVYEYDNNGRAQPIWWDGYSTGSRTINKGVRVPVGTYFYVIEFNQDRVSPVSGWVYINY